MTCDQISSLLSAWHDSELPEQERESVRTHLAACPACAKVAEDIRQLDHQLRVMVRAHAPRVKHVAQDVVRQFPRKSRQQIPWRSVFLAVSAAAAGFLLAWLVFSHPESRQLAASPSPSVQGNADLTSLQLTLATGAVEVQQQGAWQAMPTGGWVGCGAPIRTPADVRCEFRTPDGSEIRLNGQTELVFQTPRKVNLKQGQVWSTVSPAAEQFQITAALTTVTALGTQFDFLATPARTQVSVLEGKTRVTDQRGRSCEVSAGQQLNVRTNAELTPLPKQEYELFQATSWINEILVLKGRGNQELSRRIDDIFASIGQTKAEFMLEEEIRVLGDHSVVPLTKYLLSPRSLGQGDKRRVAAHIIADLAQPRSIGDLIPLLTDGDPAIRSTITAGLKRLTGQDIGLSATQCGSASLAQCQKNLSVWQEWWRINQFRCPGDSK
jgi:ferric-dicitrate binding protein FerR (iron transport regulator)